MRRCYTAAALSNGIKPPAASPRGAPLPGETLHCRVSRHCWPPFGSANVYSNSWLKVILTSWGRQNNQIVCCTCLYLITALWLWRVSLSLPGQLCKTSLQPRPGTSFIFECRAGGWNRPPSEKSQESRVQWRRAEWMLRSFLPLDPQG